MIRFRHVNRAPKFQAFPSQVPTRQASTMRRFCLGIPSHACSNHRASTSLSPGDKDINLKLGYRLSGSLSFSKRCFLGQRCSCQVFPDNLVRSLDTLIAFLLQPFSIIALDQQVPGPRWFRTHKNSEQVRRARSHSIFHGEFWQGSTFVFVSRAYLFMIVQMSSCSSHWETIEPQEIGRAHV